MSIRKILCTIVMANTVLSPTILFAQSQETHLINPNEGTFGFALGAMYGQGSAYKGSYMEGAYIDLNGRMHSRKSQDSVVRTLPAITVLATPWAQSYCEGFFCDLKRLAMLGLTVGFGGNSDSEEEQSSSQALAYGLSIGIAGENFHLAFFYGLYTEDGLYSRPTWFQENERYPLANTVEPTLAELRKEINSGDVELLSTALSIGLDIPLPETTAKYLFKGFVISFVF